MKPRILLINPPIYDFTAFDFWLKPYGLLRVAGLMRGKAEMKLFDFLDRRLAPPGKGPRPDEWGRGPYHSEEVEKPPPLDFVKRRFRRFGAQASRFREMLASESQFDFALVSTGMTYWYGGVAEVVACLRALSPRTRIVLGGTYASLCPDHALGLDADLVVRGERLDPLWAITGIDPDGRGGPLWEGYESLRTGALRLTDGCPFRCTYCSVPTSGPPFKGRELDEVMEEYETLMSLGARDVAFYDDAILVDSGRFLLPFLEKARARESGSRFHTPNAIHARLVTESTAQAMAGGGVETYFIGFESRSEGWIGRTGGKVEPDLLESAVENLARAGVDRARITAYLILGHPLGGMQDLEGSIRFVHALGIRAKFSEFSPVPGTPDFDLASRTVPLDEPLLHNKTAFPIAMLGFEEVNRLKVLSHSLNRELRGD
ncbi:MAG: B12-binding domain-containing radical SAM protein [Planctomycetota bacterium]